MTNFHVYYGPDDFQTKEAIATLKGGLNNDGMLESNTVLLEGARLSFEELRSVCSTVPFLSNVRLVIVDGLLHRFDGSGRRRSGRSSGKAGQRGGTDLAEWEELPSFLSAMPPTTVLVWMDGPVSATNGLLQSVRAIGQVHEFQQLQGAALTAWIVERAKALDAAFSQSAVRLLAEYVGPNLWQMASEVQKLALYAAGRSVTDADVKEMVSASSEVSVFSLVDAVVAGRRDEAIRLVRQLVHDGSASPQLFAMLVTQYRRLLQTRELLDAGTPRPEIGRRVGINSDFALRKVAEQASRYPIPRIESAYQRLLEADVAVKTGVLDEDLSLELLIDDLCAVARR